MIVSLDGFIEGPERELDWFLDGDPSFERYCDEMIDSVGLALYGRRAYELMLAYWPAEPQAAREAARTLLVRLSSQERATIVLRDVFEFRSRRSPKRCRRRSAR